MFDGKTMENHHFSWENSLFLWPFSIAMQMFTRGYELNQPESAGEKNLCLNYSKWFVKKSWYVGEKKVQQYWEILHHFPHRTCHLGEYSIHLFRTQICLTHTKCGQYLEISWVLFPVAILTGQVEPMLCAKILPVRFTLLLNRGPRYIKGLHPWNIGYNAAICCPQGV